MKIHKLSAYGLGAFVLTFGATLAFGQARVPYTRPPYLTTSGPITTTGNVTAERGLFTATSGDSIEINSGRTMCFNAPTCSAGGRLFYNGSNMQAGGGFVASALITTTSVNSSTASGNNAYTCTNVGCRLSLGSTGRYLTDDGTNLEFVAPVQGTSFEATNTTGSSFTGGNSSNSLTITSNTPDSVTSSTVPAILLKASENIASADLLLSVEDSAGNIRLALSENAIMSSLVEVGSQRLRLEGEIYSNSASSPFVTYHRRGATATEAAFRAGNSVIFTSDDSKIAEFGYYPSGVWTGHAHFSKEGLLRVNATNAARPTCNSSNRGRVYYSDGAAGVADTYEICMKDAADAYAWETIVAP